MWWIVAPPESCKTAYTYAEMALEVYGDTGRLPAWWNDAAGRCEAALDAGAPAPLWWEFQDGSCDAIHIDSKALRRWICTIMR
jgi:hypothetical protein